MKKVVVLGRTACYFLILGIGLPLLLNRPITAGYTLACLGIAVAISLIPQYVSVRLRRRATEDRTRRGRKWRHLLACVLRSKWTRMGCATAFFYLLMVVVIPSLQGMKVDTAWLVISAITAPAVAALGEYLTELRRQRRQNHDQRSDQTPPTET